MNLRDQTKGEVCYSKIKTVVVFTFQVTLERLRLSCFTWEDCNSPGIRCLSIASRPSVWSRVRKYKYTWMEGEIVRVKCLVKEHNTTTQSGFKPLLFYLVSNTHLIGSLHFCQINQNESIKEMLTHFHFTIYLSRKFAQSFQLKGSPK